MEELYIYMKRRSKKIRFRPALTLLEMSIAIAITAVVFAVLVPQLRALHNSWDSRAGEAETLQNGKVLIEHLNTNLSKAARITSVSGPAETNGYIEFLGNDANGVRYDVNSITNYVQFGPVGNLSDLAGPVSKLQFTCYDAFDLDTPITDVNAIRCVKVETTLTNSASLGRDMTLATQAYIRSNTLSAAGGEITKMSDPWLEYDINNGQYPYLLFMSGSEYLCAYTGDRDDGWVCIITVNSGDWSVTASGFLEYDTKRGTTPVLAKIDDTHFLCVYQGDRGDGWSHVLYETAPGVITDGPHKEFDTADCTTPALCQIDVAHYLCTYADMDTGYTVKSVVLTVDTGSWSISSGTSTSFAGSYSPAPALAKIDNTHYLCAYTGQTGSTHGAAVVLTVNTADWTITPGTHFDFYGEAASGPELAKIDDEHYLCTYWASNDALATVLTVDLANWTVTKNIGPDFYLDTMTSTYHQLSRIDSTNFLCAYPGLATGKAVVLTVNTGDWSVGKKTPATFESSSCYQTALCQIDTEHYLCAYAGPGSDGFAGVLELSAGIRP
jgi:competence protein ComGC